MTHLIATRKIQLNVNSGLKPGVIYELIYEAKNPVLAGSGMAAIRDLVSLIRFQGEEAEQLNGLGLPDIHTPLLTVFSEWTIAATVCV